MKEPAVLDDAAELTRLRPGEPVWLRVRGRCMEPVIRSGDVLQIEACTPDELARGDVAAVRHEDGTYRAHLVVGTAPVRTGTLAGDRDVGRIEVLGRVTAVRSEGGTIRLGSGSRPVLWAAWWVAFAAARTGLRARARAAVESVALSPAGKHFRERLWGPFDVKAMTLADSSDLAHFAATQALMDPREALHALRTRWIGGGAAAVGAFDRRGRLVGIAIADTPGVAHTAAEAAEISDEADATEAPDARSRGADARAVALSTFHLRRAVRRMGLATRLMAALEAEVRGRELSWLDDAAARERVALAFER